MTKKKPVFLIERRTTAIAASEELLHATSTFGKRGFGFQDLEKFAFEQHRFGPFENDVKAFSYLGEHYRFNLTRHSDFDVTNTFLIQKRVDLFRAGCKIEYFLQYETSRRTIPVTNLAEVITRYYPHGPDI